MATDVDYDLLVLDLNLPKLDGLSLLRNLRPSKPQIPVLVLTARPRVEDRVQALDSDADDCVNKPFSYSELSGTGSDAARPALGGIRSAGRGPPTGPSGA
jgi:DNA-binding response OmpR family regulator